MEFTPQELELIQDILTWISVTDYSYFDTGCIDPDSKDEQGINTLVKLSEQKNTYIELTQKFNIEIDIDELRNV